MKNSIMCTVLALAVTAVCAGSVGAQTATPPSAGGVVELPAVTSTPPIGIGVVPSNGTITGLIGTVTMPDGRVGGTAQLTETGENLISITLDDVEMVDVVRMFTRISGANIVAAGTNLTGRVTVNLTDVEWKPALRSILDMHNLALVEKTPGSGVYSILTKQADAPEPLVVETLFLDHTTVDVVGPVVKSMLAQNAVISEFPSRNAMVIKSTSANLAEIMSLVDSIDIPGKQVCIETKFMELNDEAAKQLGIRWDSLEEFGLRLDAGPFSYDRGIQRNAYRDNQYTTSDERSFSDTLTDNRSSLDDSQEFFDKDGNQIEYVTEEWVDHDGNALTPPILQTTTDPTLTRSVGRSSGRDTVQSTVIGQGEYHTIMDDFTKSITEQQAAILELDSFQVVLSALKRTEGVSIISNPKIIVANGTKDAFFSSGVREPLIRTELQRGTTDSPGDKIVAELDTSVETDNIQGGYVHTGLELNVIPVVKTDDLIEAQIHPRLIRKLGDKVFADNSWPILSVKEIKTEFTLRSGQTVAIGGLTDTTDDERVSKVPLLGDVPLIGKYLFSHTKEVKSQVETIIFVTLSLAEPTIIDVNEGIPQDSRLVHTEMIRSQAEREEFEAGLEKLRAAQDAPAEDEPEEPKSRLLGWWR